MFGHSRLLVRAQSTRGWFVPVYASCLITCCNETWTLGLMSLELKTTSRRLSMWLASLTANGPPIDFSACLTKRDGLSVGWFYSTICDKLGFKNASFVLSSLNLPGPTGEASNKDRVCIPKKVRKMLHGRFVHVGKTLTDMQILGCALHQNAFGGLAPPGPAGRAMALPQTL